MIDLRCKALTTAAVVAWIATAAFAAEPGDGDWPMAARDYASTRYSPLDQVTAANIADLAEIV